jgi:MoaA/NifB/PqqE/SkfB family radical SAM enzyme
MAATQTNLQQNYSRSVSDLPALSSKDSRLPNLTIELTDRCNNDCKHCYINRPALDSQAMGKEMGTDFIKNLISQAAELGCLDIGFTGGEPLLREDFKELYLYSRQNGFRVTVATNGRLITSDLAKLFHGLPPGRPIGITVYGMSSETYDRVSRIRGSFEEFLQGVHLLEEYRIDFTLKMAVLPDNRSDVPAFEDWIKKLFHGKLKPVYMTNFSQRARHDDPDRNRLIRSLRMRPEETIDLLTRNQGYFGELLEFCRQYSGPQGDGLFPCGFGRSIYVDAYGFAQGCLLLRHPELIYSLHGGTLKEAFTAYFPKQRIRRATRPSFLNHCADCCLRGLCAQCPAQSWMEHGTLDTPVEFQCSFAHAYAQKLGLLAAEENGWEVLDWRSRLNRLYGKYSETLSFNGIDKNTPRRDE